MKFTFMFQSLTCITSNRVCFSQPFFHIRHQFQRFKRFKHWHANNNTIGEHIERQTRTMLSSAVGNVPRAHRYYSGIVRFVWGGREITCAEAVAANGIVKIFGNKWSFAYFLRIFEIYYSKKQPHSSIILSKIRRK